MSFFWPTTGSVMLEYLVRWAPEDAAVMIARTGMTLRPAFWQISVTWPTPKKGSTSGVMSPRLANAAAHLQQSIPEPPSMTITMSGFLCMMWL